MKFFAKGLDTCQYAGYDIGMKNANNNPRMTVTTDLIETLSYRKLEDLCCTEMEARHINRLEVTLTAELEGDNSVGYNSIGVVSFEIFADGVLLDLTKEENKFLDLCDTDFSERFMLGMFTNEQKGNW